MKRRLLSYNDPLPSGNYLLVQKRGAQYLVTGVVSGFPFPGGRTFGSESDARGAIQQWNKYHDGVPVYFR